MAFIRQERETAVVEEIVKFVTFALGSEKYAVPVLRVKEIIAKYDVAPLPKTPVFVEGIISLRGDIIPVVDLRKRFDLPVKVRTDETRLIVLEMDDFFVGIEVDEVFEVLKINAGQIEPPPALVAGLESDYLEGVCEIGGRLITILNLDEIFSPQERSELQESGEKAKEPAAPVVPQKRAEMGRAASDEPAPQKQPQEIRLIASKVESDGRLKADGRAFFVGKGFAGRELQVELSGTEVRIKENGKQIKSFKRAG